MRPRYTVAEARDIAMHVLVMRACIINIAHLKFHGVRGLSRQWLNAYVDHAVLLTRHFHVSWLPFGLAAVALRRFNRVRVFEVSERIMERIGPCPNVHAYADENLDDIERYANGEATS